MTNKNFILFEWTLININHINFVNLLYSEKSSFKIVFISWDKLIFDYDSLEEMKENLTIFYKLINSKWKFISE